MKKLCILLLVLLTIYDVWAKHISPPQYTLRNKLYRSIGTNSCVKVSAVKQDEKGYFIDVIGCNQEMSNSLKFILINEHRFGEIVVDIRVINAEKNNDYGSVKTQDERVELVKDHLENVLKGTSFFSETIKPPPSPFQTYALFINSNGHIVQFYNDNLMDFSGWSHFLAQDVFRTILKEIFFNESNRPVMVSYSTQVHLAP